MPQFDPAIFPAQLFWLAVTFIALLVAMRGYALPRMAKILESRRTRIDEDLEKAGLLKQEADAVLNEYEQGLEEARGRASVAVKQASDEIAGESARRLQAHAKELAETTRVAEERIAAARADALGQLAAVAAEVAAAATHKLIGADIDAARLRRAVEETIQSRG